MTDALPSGDRAVMNRRLTGTESRDYFPTPPWATRALCEHILGRRNMMPFGSAWEPAAGEGHMAEVLAEYFAAVRPSDIHDYGKGYGIGSFVGDRGSTYQIPTPAEWIITNPPFNLAVEFAERALKEATEGVALLVRTNWLEGADRYRRLFSVRPPNTIALFAERVPMVQGRWDPKASTATSYAWMVWRVGTFSTDVQWIPPGRRQALTRPDDVARFASPALVAARAAA